MQFSLFSHYLQKIERTTKRLEMTEILAELFTKLDTDEVRLACYLMQGRVVPQYESKQFQLSTKMIIRVLAGFIPEKLDGSDSPVAQLTKRYKQLGDGGILAEEVITTHGKSPQKVLSIAQVFTDLTQIADESGEGSQARKITLTQKLLSAVDALSARYIVRIILGNMRLGFSDMTMIDALSWKLKGDKSVSSSIETAYQKRADIGLIAETVLHQGISALSKISVKVGTPVIPALCQRLNTAQEIIDKMGTVYAEPKYDGTRVQIHFDRNGELRTYTRNLEENSAMFPELQNIGKALNCDSCILDSEAIGYDPQTGALLPFQQTIQRKRKHGVRQKAEDIPLKFFIFDVLAVDGKSLIEQPLSERKKVLQTILQSSDSFVDAAHIETDDPKVLHNYHEQQLAEGLEGVVIKKVDAAYQSGRKGYSWVKIKETEGVRGKLSDTVDGVVMGYFYGTGKRAQFGMGAVLIGVLNDQDQVVTISKVGSGFTEASTQEFVKRAKPFIVESQPNMYQVNDLLLPDVWLEPSIVIEVAADEITHSPSHTSGVALRFPRIIRFRDDKKWQQATTLKEIKQISS